MTKRILGIDCSSTTIGISALEIDDSNKICLVKSDYIKPPKKGHIIERIAITRDKVRTVIDEVKPDYIAIEEIIQFMKGASTAKTVIMLTSFNRMVCLLAHDYLGHPPDLYNVMSIRHSLKTDKKFPSKEQMPELVAKHLDISFPYVYSKKQKDPVCQKIKTESYDMADAIAVGLHHAFLLTGKIKAKKKK